MRVLAFCVLSAAFLIGTSSSTSAQTIEAPQTNLDLDQAQTANDPELVRWMEQFAAWKEWWAQWANRPEPGWLTSARPRREKPAPPVWLADRCAEVFAETDPLAPACAALDEWRQPAVASITGATRATAVQAREDNPKLTWWEHVHVDLLWPATQVREHIYGVIGMHTATTVRGRLQVFLAPGVMLMNLPTGDGKRAWKVAANYGIGYRLADFTLPGGRAASLHVNIAKSWLMSDTRDLLVSRNTDFAGFSITFKK